jgi:hypothetical protein
VAARRADAGHDHGDLRLEQQDATGTLVLEADPRTPLRWSPSARTGTATARHDDAVGMTATTATRDQSGRRDPVRRRRPELRRNDPTGRTASTSPAIATTSIPRYQARPTLTARPGLRRDRGRGPAPDRERSSEPRQRPTLRAVRRGV